MIFSARRHSRIRLAHQKELLEQALHRLESIAAELPRTERIHARLFSGDALPIAALAEKKTDVAFVTIQSFAQSFEAKKLKRLHAFLQERPTIIVIDEAHHAGAPTYETVLSAASSHVVGLLGLTATPHPGSPGARERFKTRFPTRVVEVELEDLVQQQILARQVTTTIETGFEVTLNTEEARLMDQYPDFQPQSWLDSTVRSATA